MESPPYDYKPFTEEESRIHRKIHTKDSHDYIRVGPAGFVLPKRFLVYADGIRNLPLRPDDIFVVTYPRSGTTWTQELVWLVANDLDFETAKSIPLQDRFPFIESPMFFLPEAIKEFSKDDGKVWAEMTRPVTDVLNATTSQRLIKTHLPLSMLPVDTLSTTKVVYVARDMRDVAVSCYHFYKANNLLGITCDLKQYYLDIFAKDLINWSPYFEHIKEAWLQKEHPNMLFLFYEELSKDLKATTRRVADFLGKRYTDEQLDALCSHLGFDNFQNNKSVHLKELDDLGIVTNKAFIREGKSGGWHKHFDEEMTQHAEKWINDELCDTDLIFPQ